MVKEAQKETSRFTAGKGIEALSITLRPQETALYVFYDIESDRVRTRVANICKDYGLERIQFSGFLGTLSKNRREELHLKLKKTLGKKPGRVLMQPVCEKDFKSLQEVINEPEEAK
jgi:CRISPR-associated protein Cas2